MLKHFLAVVALAAAAPALGQGDLAGLLNSKEVPATMKLKDLNAEWKRVTITSTQGAGGMGDMMKNLMQMGMMSEMGKNKGGGEDAAGAMMAMSMLGGLFGGAGDTSNPTYYTKFIVHPVGTESFLVVYRLNVKAPNIMEMAMKAEKDGGKEPDFAKLAAEAKPSGETEVELTLLNLRSVASIGGIRSFDLAKEIEEAGKSGGLMDLLGMAGKDGDKPGDAVPDVPENPAEDAVATVEFAMISDPQLSKGNVQVSTANGKVVLKGTVASANLKTRAENLARRALKGAGSSMPISNQIMVRAGKK